MQGYQLVSLIREYPTAGWNIQRLASNPNLSRQQVQMARSILNRPHKPSVVLNTQLIRHTVANSPRLTLTTWYEQGPVTRNSGELVLAIRNPNMPIDDALVLMSVARASHVEFVSSVSDDIECVSHPCICENPNVTYEVARRELAYDVERNWKDSARALSRNGLLKHHVQWRWREAAPPALPPNVVQLVTDYMPPTEPHVLAPIGILRQKKLSPRTTGRQGRFS
jgi:hypothetical protein